MSVNHLEKIMLNNDEQWLLVRGKNINAPLIIHVQAGPGLPIIPEAYVLEKLLHLEDNFIVAYWDQRGCGKSYTKNTDERTLNLSQLTDDVISCIQYLLEKYKKDKAIIIGYSIGATLSLLAAEKNKDFFQSLFLVGIDIDMPAATKHALNFMSIKSKDDPKRLKQVHELSKVPIISSSLFQKRAKLLTNMGGIKIGSSYNKLLFETISNLLFCKAYRLSDIPKTIKGMEFCQDALLPEFDTFNLFDRVKKIEVPVHFVQGKQDGIAPYQIAVNYFNFLQADEKTFTSFDQSAHMPHYDEPEKFSDLIKKTVYI